MTLHGSKGLEFPHVFITGMEENMFPGYRAVNSTDPAAMDCMEEEKRLCYVGITRARKSLTLTSVAQRMNCQLPTAISPSGRMTGACRRKDNFCYPE